MIRAALVVALVACTTPRTIAPPPAAPPVAAKGRVVTERFRSEALGVDKAVVVYLPAGYEDGPATRWPVFYYLHGLTGDETDWTERARLHETADALGLQAIIVMPDGDDSFYVNAVTPIDYDACMKDGTGLLSVDRSGGPLTRTRAATCVRKRDYATYIVNDLVGWVDRTYRTIATREGRAIAGLSMGGFGALQLALRHRDRFAAAASHAGVVALLYEGPYPYVAGEVKLATDVSAWGGRLGPFGAWIRGIFGPDIENWRAHEPVSLVGTLEPGELALYIDCGTEDEFRFHDHAAYLHDILKARTIEHAFYLGPGRHDRRFWGPRAKHSLAFLASKTAKPTN